MERDLLVSRAAARCAVTGQELVDVAFPELGNATEALLQPGNFRRGAWVSVGHEGRLPLVAEVAAAAQALGVAPTTLSQGPLSSEWLSAGLRWYGRARFFELVNAIADSNGSGLLGADTSEPGCEELLRFLTQGYHFPSLVQAELESKSQYLRFLPYGTFSPHEALECLHDQLRTKRFIQAVCAHCEDLLGERQGELSVVDAGCGPLPVLAIAAAYCSPRVRVVGLESNPASADIAKRIVSSLGLDSQIEIVETNAVAWKSALPIDLLVSETLDSGLVRENFHQIVNHLRPYLSRKGRIVPEHLEIQGGFAQPEEFSRDHLEPILKWKTDEALGERISLPLSYALGELNPREGGAVVVQTRLTLYQRRNDKEPIELNPGESLITRRVVLRDAEQVLADLQSEDDTRGAPSRDQVVNISYHYPPGHRLLLTAKTAPS